MTIYAPKCAASTSSSSKDDVPTEISAGPILAGLIGVLFSVKRGGSVAEVIPYVVAQDSLPPSNAQARLL
jgi:hypothetical protein